MIFDIFDSNALYIILTLFFIIAVVIAVIRRASRFSDSEDETYDIIRTPQSAPVHNAKIPKQLKPIADNSDKIKALIEINAQYSFKSFDPRQRHSYDCNSKREFDRMSVKGYFYNCVSIYFDRYSRIIECIRYNKSEYEIYLSKVNALRSTATEELCESLKISLKKFKRREEKLFKRLTQLPPLCDVDVFCKITYTSPAGRNHYRDTGNFDFSDLEQTYEKVRRQRAERETREYKIKQERLKMSASLRYEILQRDGNRCKICGATAKDGVKLHVDHIIPVAKGGKTEWSNLRTLCERCNLGKSDKYDGEEAETEQTEEKAMQKDNPPFSKYFSQIDSKVSFYGNYTPLLMELVAKKEFDEIRKIILNQLQKFDNVIDATDKHFFLLTTVEKIYPYRENEQCLELVKEICEIDIANVRNLVNKMGSSFHMITPTKLALIMEREGKIEKAIDICRLCEQYKIWDNDKKPFTLRREKLEAKLEKKKAMVSQINYERTT